MSNVKIPEIVKGFVPRENGLTKYDEPVRFGVIRRGIVWGVRELVSRGLPTIELRVGWGQRPRGDGTNASYVIRVYARGATMDAIKTMAIRRGDRVNLKVAVRQTSTGFSAGEIRPGRRIMKDGEPTGGMGNPVVVANIFHVDGVPDIQRFGHINLPPSLYDNDQEAVEVGLGADGSVTGLQQADPGADTEHIPVEDEPAAEPRAS